MMANKKSAETDAKEAVAVRAGAELAFELWGGDAGIGNRIYA